MSTKRKKLALVTGLASLTLFDIAIATAAPVSTYSWTGFYSGVDAGYRWAEGNFASSPYTFLIPGSGTQPFPARSENYNLNSGIVGLHGGYNFMITPTILAGVEGDWTWGFGKDNRSATFTIFDGTALRSSEVNLTWQATIRGRLGVVNGPWLFYGTAGAAFIHAKWSDNISASGSFPSIAASWAASKTLTGWTAGVGIERMLDSNWIARVEYLYENFGSFSVPHGFGPQTGTLDIGDAHKLRVGISYKFGG